MEKTPTGLERAFLVAGSMAELARLLGRKRGVVNHWKTRVPAEVCPEIERVTNGQVRCEDLRPDIAWDVLRAPAKEAA